MYFTFSFFLLHVYCMQIYTGTQPQYRNQADSELLTLFPPTQEALHEIDEILKDQFGISLIDADDAKERVIPSKAQLVAAHPSSLGTHKQILQEAMTTTQDFSYALMFTINALQSCADVYWKHIAGENRQIMFLLLHVLQHRYAQLPSWIRNSMMKLVARLSLLYWRRLGLHRTLLQECQKFVGVRIVVSSFAFKMVSEFSVLVVCVLNRRTTQRHCEN